MTSSQAKQIAEQYLSWLGVSTPHAVAKLEAMIEEALEGQWMPIETAPKDNTPILTCAGMFVGTGRYVEKFAGLYGDTSPGWYSEQLDRRYYPTMWRPLPLPPNPKD